MNILASYNWIKEYVAAKTDPADFAKRLSLSGPSVERSYPQAPAFEHMVVGRIVEVRPHPDADRLRIVVTDIGKRTAEVVCGGSNLVPEMKVLVALPGAKVRWHGEGEPVTLEPTKIRGVASEGMICGANEVGLADAFPHEEKEILDLSWCKARPGTPVAKALDLEDTVFDIEVTTNRPDAFSIVGLAREAAAILDGSFSWKEPVLPGVSKGVDAIPLAVKVLSPKLCTRYEAVALTDVAVGPSPWWIKKRLQQSGIRPINNVVDITNYVMLEHGQPMHAFDLDTLSGRAIVVRNAKDGETIETLDGKTQKLTKNMLVIADAERPVAVAGVMGGEATGVTERTRTIVFESATFDPVSVRRTARALNTHSDSSLRFEKGLPEEQTHAALARAVELCQSIAMGKVASAVADVRSMPRRKVRHAFRPERAAALIGADIPKRRMAAILKSLGFGVAAKGRKFEVTVPYWRERDIEGERDLVEEIARIHGYHNLPSLLPAGELPVRPADPIFGHEASLTRFFRGAGYTGLLTYSLVPSEVLKKAGFDPAAALRVANPLSSDFEYMRPSLIPGALAVISENQGLFPQGRLFEVSNVYLPRKDDLPEERVNALAVAYGPESGDALFREVKGLIEAWCPSVCVEAQFVREIVGGLWHPGRTVRLVADGTVFGTVGEVHPAVLKKFGIDGRVAMLDADLVALMPHCAQGRQYEPIPQYPPALRDLAFVVGEREEYAALKEALLMASDLASDVELFDVYRGRGITEGKKSIAVHLTFAHPEKTLTAEEVEAEVGRMTAALAEKFGAAIRS